MINLNFRDSNIEIPDHESKIRYIELWSDYSDINFGEVEWSIDNDNGDSFCYSLNEEIPDGYNVKVIINGWLIPRYFWIYDKELTDQLDSYEDD